MSKVLTIVEPSVRGALWHALRTVGSNPCHVMRCMLYDAMPNDAMPRGAPIHGVHHDARMLQFITDQCTPIKTPNMPPHVIPLCPLLRLLLHPLPVCLCPCPLRPRASAAPVRMPVVRIT